MRAMFNCESVTDYGYEHREAKLRAVCSDGHPEHNQFAEATPAGELSMYIDNPSVKDFFKPGKKYYLDFIEAEESQEE